MKLILVCISLLVLLTFSTNAQAQRSEDAAAPTYTPAVCNQPPFCTRIFAKMPTQIELVNSSTPVISMPQTGGIQRSELDWLINIVGLLVIAFIFLLAYLLVQHNRQAQKVSVNKKQ